MFELSLKTFRLIFLYFSNTKNVEDIYSCIVQMFVINSKIQRNFFHYYEYFLANYRTNYELFRHSLNFWGQGYFKAPNRSKILTSQRKR